ncbi:unnamed protein product [Parascedosporium putredinis]|uniref:Uncharacterized protein n=1 Tax=Parascedosporium putredinis TaxID=1442378 RepID=A0A9P1H663_9PEZI|nr:unnamed protein product [Parascedosporium putredinis]CAI7999945.1 unnamed protein product [Parascedosporium putredinis]
MFHHTPTSSPARHHRSPSHPRLIAARVTLGNSPPSPCYTDPLSADALFLRSRLTNVADRKKLVPQTRLGLGLIPATSPERNQQLGLFSEMEFCSRDTPSTIPTRAFSSSRAINLASSST